MIALTWTRLLQALSPCPRPLPLLGSMLCSGLPMATAWQRRQLLSLTGRPAGRSTCSMGYTKTLSSHAAPGRRGPWPPRSPTATRAPDSSSAGAKDKEQAERLLQDAAPVALPCLAAEALDRAAATCSPCLAALPGMAALLAHAAQRAPPPQAASGQAAGGTTPRELLGFAAALDAAQREAMAEELAPLLLAAAAGGGGGSGSGAAAAPHVPIVFDTETQGFDLHHRVVDICLHDLSSGQVFETLMFPSPVRPEWSIMPMAASDKHGILAHHLRAPGVPSSEAASLALAAWILQRCLAVSPLGARLLFIAHNAPFDLKMTERLLSLSSVRYAPGWLALCTIKWARRKWPERKAQQDPYRLDTLCRELLNVTAPQAHRARPDVELLLRLLPLLLAEDAKGLTLHSAVDKLRHNLGKFQLEELVVPASRYSGTTHGALGKYCSDFANARQAAYERASHAVLRAAGMVSVAGHVGVVAAGAGLLNGHSAASGGRGTAVVAAAMQEPAAGSAASAASAAAAATLTATGRGGTAQRFASPPIRTRSRLPLWQSPALEPSPPAAPSPPQPPQPSAARQSAPSTRAPPASAPPPSSLQAPSPASHAGGHSANGRLASDWGSSVAGSARFVEHPDFSTMTIFAMRMWHKEKKERERAAARDAEALDGVVAAQAVLGRGTVVDEEGVVAGNGRVEAAGGGDTAGAEGPAGSGQSPVEAERPKTAVRGRAASAAAAPAAIGSLAGGKAATAVSKAERVGTDSDDASSSSATTSVGAVRRGRRAAIALSNDGGGGDPKVALELTALNSSNSSSTSSELQEGGRRPGRQRKSLGMETGPAAEGMQGPEPQGAQETVGAAAEAAPSASSSSTSTSASSTSSSSSVSTTRRRGRAAAVAVPKQMSDTDGSSSTGGAKRPGRRKAQGQAVSAAAEALPIAVDQATAESPLGAAAAADESAPGPASAPPPPALPPPVWEPCGVGLDAKAASKWFPPAQMQKLRNAGFKSLLQVLMFYPKRHLLHSETLDPSLAVQEVAVVGTATKVACKQMGFKCTMFNITLEVPARRQQQQQQQQLAGLLDGDGGGGGSDSDRQAAALLAEARDALPAGGNVLVNASVVAAGRWALGPMMELQRRFPQGSQVLLRGTVKAAGASRDGQLVFECTTPDLMEPKEYDPSRHAVTPVYATRAELKGNDFVTKGKRKGVIDRALEVLHKHASSEVEPLAALPQAALEALDAAAAAPPPPLPAGPAAGPAAAAAASAPPGAAAAAASGGLLPWREALAEVHSPTSREALALARRCLALVEMTLVQLTLRERRARLLAARPGRRAAACAAPELVQRAIGSLPFTLTDGQTVALREVLDDMAGAEPMYRLLQGDVGSGKTVIAMLAMLAAAGSGRQAVLLAPTEVLAEQHFAKLQELLSGLPVSTSRSMPAALLTSSAKNKKAALQAIAEGRSMLLVGTHALLHVPSFKALGLVVIDEQHKFGVKQKEAIARLQHSEQPHILSMSATPIPRTIALVQFGDMVLSTLREVPPHRKPVITTVLTDTADNRKVVFDAVRKDLDEGGRVFFVYPLREPSVSDPEFDDEYEDEDDGGGRAKGGRGSKQPALDLRSAEKEFAALKKSKAFGAHRCALLHGQMTSEEKAAAIASFRDGTTPALVCTVVVEVGIDVPDATMLVVEHADRFGLAQLHQLRGRVGRGSRQSRCFLLAPPPRAKDGGGDDGKVMERLTLLEGCHSGFEIAEHDLRLRGAGQAFGTGTRQSGGLDATALCTKEIAQDPRIVEAARQAAAATLPRSTDRLPLQLAAAAAAFKEAVKRRPRSTSLFGGEEDEGEEDGEGGASGADEPLGIAV